MGFARVFISNICTYIYIFTCIRKRCNITKYFFSVAEPLYTEIIIIIIIIIMNGMVKSET